MLAQTVALIATLSLVSLGILTTDLLSAGLVRQNQTVKYTTLAMNDGVNDFTALLSSYVKRNGVGGPWPTTFPASPTYRLCGDATPTDGGCAYTYTVSASITGSSSTPTGLANDQAENLQKFDVTEERVSAAVTVAMSDAAAVVSSEKRFVTYRVLTAPPYAMISGERDIQAINGTETSIEADSGGVLQNSTGQNYDSTDATPNPGAPQNYNDTTIKAKLTCSTVDDIQNPDAIASTNPYNDQGSGNRNLPWGIGTTGGYELPCTDKFYKASAGQFSSERWHNGN